VAQGVGPEFKPQYWKKKNIECLIRCEDKRDSCICWWEITISKLCMYLHVKNNIAHSREICKQPKCSLTGISVETVRCIGNTVLCNFPIFILLSLLFL
jgi:hypothetical protein